MKTKILFPFLILALAISCSESDPQPVEKPACRVLIQTDPNQELRFTYSSDGRVASRLSFDWDSERYQRYTYQYSDGLLKMIISSSQQDSTDLPASGEENWFTLNAQQNPTLVEYVFGSIRETYQRFVYDGDKPQYMVINIGSSGNIFYRDSLVVTGWEGDNVKTIDRYEFNNITRGFDKLLTYTFTYSEGLNPYYKIIQTNEIDYYLVGYFSKNHSTGYISRYPNGEVEDQRSNSATYNQDNFPLFIDSSTETTEFVTSFTYQCGLK